MVPDVSPLASDEFENVIATRRPDCDRTQGRAKGSIRSQPCALRNTDIEHPIFQTVCLAAVENKPLSVSHNSHARLFAFSNRQTLRSRSLSIGGRFFRFSDVFRGAPLWVKQYSPRVGFGKTRLESVMKRGLPCRSRNRRDPRSRPIARNRRRPIVRRVSESGLVAIGNGSEPSSNGFGLEAIGADEGCPLSLHGPGIVPPQVREGDERQGKSQEDHGPLCGQPRREDTFFRMTLPQSSPVRHGRSVEVHGSGGLECPEVAARGRNWPNSSDDTKMAPTAFPTVSKPLRTTIEGKTGVDGNRTHQTSFQSSHWV